MVVAVVEGFKSEVGGLLFGDDFSKANQRMLVVSQAIPLQSATRTPSKVEYHPWLQTIGDKSKFGFIQFGLNLNAKPGFLFNRIIRGAVTVGIGDNRWFGGKNESSTSWSATSLAATVKLDNKTIIDKGKMIL